MIIQPVVTSLWKFVRPVTVASPQAAGVTSRIPTSDNEDARTRTIQQSDVGLFCACCRGAHAASEGLLISEEARKAGGAACDSMGPPGHTPFRSSRFMPPGEDSGDGQVSPVLRSPHEACFILP